MTITRSKSGVRNFPITSTTPEGLSARIAVTAKNTRLNAHSGTPGSSPLIPISKVVADVLGIQMIGPSNSRMMDTNTLPGMVPILLVTPSTVPSLLATTE